MVDIPNPEGGAHVTLQCQGNLGQIQLAQCPFGFLNGRTGVNDGGVDLAPNTGPPFSGTRWEVIVAPVPPDGGDTALEAPPRDHMVSRYKDSHNPLAEHINRRGGVRFCAR